MRTKRLSNMSQGYGLLSQIASHGLLALILCGIALGLSGGCANRDVPLAPWPSEGGEGGQSQGEAGEGGAQD
jgi:hypothetical protein